MRIVTEIRGVREAAKDIVQKFVITGAQLAAEMQFVAGEHVARVADASLIVATRVDLVRSFVMERFLSMDITGRCHRRRLVGDKEMRVERCIEQ